MDGNLGIWPFVHWLPAVRASKNRPPDTIEMKSTSVDRELYRDFLVNKVISSITDKMAAWKEYPLYIQKDSARPHVTEKDSGVLSATRADG